MPRKYRKYIHNSLLCKLSLFSAGPSALLQIYNTYLWNARVIFYIFAFYLLAIYIVRNSTLWCREETVVATVMTPPVHRRTLLRAPVLPFRQRRCYVTTFRRMWWKSVEKRRRWLPESLPGTRKLNEKLTNWEFCVCTSFCWHSSSCCLDLNKNVWRVSLWCGQKCVL